MFYFLVVNAVNFHSSQFFAARTVLYIIFGIKNKCLSNFLHNLNLKQQYNTVR